MPVSSEPATTASRARRLARDARWWALDYAYAVHWQLRALIGPQDPSAYRTGSKSPLVVVPGVWETWAFLRPLIERLHDTGHPVHVVAGLGWNGKPVEQTARAVADYILREDLRGVVLVTHSKGGLVGKYVMALLDDSHRVESMAAVCAPFSGSRYAPYLLLRSLRAFSPRDPTTVLLGKNLEINRRIVSLYGEFDPHIPQGSELQGATNVRLAAGGHFRILAHPRVFRAIVELGKEKRDD